MDIIDECLKELESETPQSTELITILAPLTLEDDVFLRPYQDDNVRECLTLTPCPMPSPKQP